MNKTIQIPEKALDEFCLYLKYVIVDFFEKPENVAEFEQWQKSRNLQKV